MLRALILAMALSLTAGQAHHARADMPWEVDPAASEVAFEYMKDGAPAAGVFTTFQGSGTFDPANPSAARFQLRIQTDSIDLYDRLASAFAESAEWFDSKNHPDIVYNLERLTLREGNIYEARGLITIRGKTQPLDSVLTLEISDETAEARGSLRIPRLDFLLGVGPSAAFVEIGPDVQVRFRLVAGRVQ